MKKYVKHFLLSLIIVSVINFLNLGAAYAAPIPLYSGWVATSGPTYLGNTGSIYFNSSNDVGGVKSKMRASYSYTARRTRVLGYKLMQTQIYPDYNVTDHLNVHEYTDIQHPDGRLGYTEWFDSPYGVYLDYQHSRLPGPNDPRNITLENTIVSETISYNRSINNTNKFAIVSTSSNNGGLSDAKGVSMLLRRGVVNGSIYLSSSTTVDTNVKSELKSRGIKTVYLAGGFARFTNDALFNDGFNVIRIGGDNRQHTLDLSNNMPNSAKTPPRKFGNVDGGLIIEGISSGDVRYSKVKSYLTNLKNTKNTDYLKQAFNYLIMYNNIGVLNNVRSSSNPIVTIGVNYGGFETYCSIYASETNGTYIYNVVAPGYFTDPDLKNNSVTVSNYDYHVNGSKDYWVRLNDQFTVTAKSSINTSVFSNLYPQNEIYMTNVTDYKIGHNSSNSLYFLNSPDSQFSGISVNNISRYPSGGRNYTNSAINMNAKLDNKDYKVGMYSVLLNGTSAWWGGYYSNSEYVKTDGSPPKSDYTPLSKLNNVNSLYIMQQCIYDTRSGLVSNSPYAYVYMDGTSNKGSKIPLNKSASYFDYSKTLDLSGHLGPKYGNMRIEIWAKDNVGNEGCVKSYVINRPSPAPVSSDVTIKDYEYEDSTTKWVQADNEFLVFQKGYGTSTYPTRSNIRISSTSDHENHSVSNGYAMTVSNYGTWSTNNVNFIKNRNTLLSLSTVSDKYYGEGNYYFKANSNLNGQKFQVWGKTNTDSGGSTYDGAWLKESKLLGIDGKAPSVDYVKTGRDEIEITSKDGESGLKNVEVVLDNGTKVTDNSGKFKIDLKNSVDTTIVSTDNVGNSYTIKVGDIKTKIESDITTEVIEISGRKFLKVTATGKVINPVPGKVLTWRLKGIGDGITYSDSSNKIMNSATGGSYTYTTNIDDKYNTPLKPVLTNKPDKDSNAFVSITPLSDIDKPYNFTIEDKYDYETSWINENSKSSIFASGRKEYKYKLTRTSDKDFNPITPSVVEDSSTGGHTISLNDLESGDYKLEVTMYDYNGNPSGTAVLLIHHVQPLIHAKLEGRVTAVKDIAWEKASYPIDFSETSKFPLGEAYTFDGNPIKLGYGINFNFKMLKEQTIDSYKIEYEYYSSDGQLLKGNSNDKSFTDSDSSDGSKYNSQDNGFTLKDNTVYVKHFIPADAIFEYSNGSVYKGPVTVRFKMTFIRGPVSASKTIDLYTVITDKSAFDDLYLDKQR